MLVYPIDPTYFRRMSGSMFVDLFQCLKGNKHDQCNFWAIEMHSGLHRDAFRLMTIYGGEIIFRTPFCRYTIPYRTDVPQYPDHLFSEYLMNVESNEDSQVIVTLKNVYCSDGTGKFLQLVLELSFDVYDDGIITRSYSRSIPVVVFKINEMEEQFSYEPIEDPKSSKLPVVPHDKPKPFRFFLKTLAAFVKNTFK